MLGDDKGLSPMPGVLRASLALCLVSISSVPVAAKMAECLARPGEVPAVHGVEVEDVQSDEGELGMLRVETDRNAFMFVYFDALSEAFARARAACLGSQIALLGVELGDERLGAQWASVVFTGDPDYAPPRGTGVKTRWIIYTNSSDPDSLDPERMVLVTLPHEQVHDFQSRAGAITPRWFAEGQASWSGLRISSILSSEVGDAARAELLGRQDDASAPVDLPNWGAVRPRREAIMRQVSAEDRARMEADPEYTPSGAFRFTSDDFEADESNMPARYTAAFLVFEGLAERHGPDKVRAWAHEVSAAPGRVTSSALAESIARHFGEDMEALLSD